MPNSASRLFFTLKIGSHELLIRHDVIVRSRTRGYPDFCSPDPFDAPKGSIAQYYEAADNINYHVIRSAVDKNFDRQRKAIENAKAALEILVNEGVCLPISTPADCTATSVKGFHGRSYKDYDHYDDIGVLILNYSAPEVLSGTLATHDVRKTKEILQDVGICK